MRTGTRMGIGGFRVLAGVNNSGKCPRENAPPGGT